MVSYKRVASEGLFPVRSICNECRVVLSLFSGGKRFFSK